MKNMSNISDLEEGEIPDDSPSTLPSTKNKELPRQYVLKENKDKHKKKSCKHVIRHQIKKLVALKKTPPTKKRTFHKPHKQCPHGKPHKSGSKNSHHGYSWSPKQYNAVKNRQFSSFMENVPHKDGSKANQPENSHSKSDIVKQLESYEFSEMVAMYKAVKSQKSNNSAAKVRETTPSDIQNPKDSDEDYCEIIGETTSKKIEEITLNCEEIKKESEDEDEEELRRIALATCAKNLKANQQAESLNVCANNNAPVSASIDDNSKSSVLLNTRVDNYEVVDMEVDEESGKSPNLADNLFIIDTNPFEDFQENSNPASSSDDDFEADILRAELIESMYRRKWSADESNQEEKALVPKSDNVVVPNNPVSTIVETVLETKVLNQSSELYSQKSLPERMIHEENPLLKLNGFQSFSPKSDDVIFPKNPVSRIVKAIPEVEENKSPRLVISLKEVSSSEESDDDIPCANNNILSENPVEASIEALISDIRQKSDSNDKISNNVKTVPKAVSCLSKAQQEEYNSLMKILEEKKKVLPMIQEEIGEKNKINHLQAEDFKKVEKKLMGVSETLKNKKELLATLSKEVAEKKNVYMKSKLTAQHLKEQYVAAEKIRRVKLDEWSKSCKSFEALKKSVSDLETKTTHLQNLCSKLGSSIEGRNYSLPSAISENT